jgi:hypothetical protein
MQYPDLEPLLEDMLPKKAPLIVAKWYAHSFNSSLNLLRELDMVYSPIRVLQLSSSYLQ